MAQTAMKLFQLLLLVYLVSPVCRAANGGEYFVRPTEPTNDSCPGEPCLTLDQYINDSNLYFKSNNNTVFLFLSGKHIIFRPVFISDAQNVTLKAYHHDHPRVLFTSKQNCFCPRDTSILGACKNCSAIQFHKVSQIKVENMEIYGKHYNETEKSSVNGLSFDECENIVTQNLSVVMSCNGSVGQRAYTQSSTSGQPYVWCGGVLLHNTNMTFLKNLTLNNSGIHSQYSVNTELNDSIITNLPRQGISLKHSTNMEINNITIRESDAHCIRIELCRDIGIDHGTLMKSGYSGIEIQQGVNININDICFSNMTAVAIDVREGSINTAISNIHIVFSQLLLIGIELDSVVNTSIIDTAFVECGILCTNTTNTLFSNLTIYTSTLQLLSVLHISYSTNTTIENVMASVQNLKSTTSAADQAVVVLYHSNNVQFNHCKFSDNTISALKVVDSVITVSDTLMFINNTASLGAAIILQEKSVINLLDNASLIFTGNHATTVGGAIYVDTNTYYSSSVTGKVTLNSTCIFQTQNTDSALQFQFLNNSAGNGGSVVYGGNLGLANTGDDLNCLQTLKNISQIEPSNTLSAISSLPSRVCMCTNSTGLPDCLSVFYSHSVYPGETISLPMVVVGQDFGTGVGSVYAVFLSLKSDDEDRELEHWQYAQGVSQVKCNSLNYTIFAAPTANTVLVLSAVKLNEVKQMVTNSTVNNALKKYQKYRNGSGKFPQELLQFPLYINITVEQCPIGFTLSRLPYKCKCSQHLSQLPGVQCYIQNQIFERSGSSWIGINDDKEIEVSSHCILFFCEEGKINITLDNLHTQCRFNHSGTLCGGCQHGYSVVLGSDRCLHCSNKYLALLLPFAVAGVVLVLGIKFLDLTVSNGFINGFILYFNIIESAWFVFIPQGHDNPLAIFVALANLDLGIETCFVDGLTQYWKTWLEFVFPLYIWVISITIILLARYSRRIAQKMGINPVSVLATLFLLSYTKLLRTSITIISYSIVMLPHGTRTVWSIDGNVDYLRFKHLFLFFVALCVLIFLCIPYTLILLLGPWLFRCNNQFISRMMLRIKPILDAYYGPLKDKHRYWIGLLLLSRVVILIVLAVIPNPSRSVILLAVSFVAIGLLYMHGCARGFYSSWYVTAFEITILSNLVLFSLVKLYGIAIEIDSQLIFNIFIGAITFQFLVLVLYQTFHIVKPILFTTFGKWLPNNCLSRNDIEQEDDWDLYEEESLMTSLAAVRNEDDEEDKENEEDEDKERVSIDHSGLTYGV